MDIVMEDRDGVVDGPTSTIYEGQNQQNSTNSCNPESQTNNNDFSSYSNVPEMSHNVPNTSTPQQINAETVGTLASNQPASNQLASSPNQTAPSTITTPTTNLNLNSTPNCLPNGASQSPSNASNNNNTLLPVSIKRLE